LGKTFETMTKKLIVTNEEVSDALELLTFSPETGPAISRGIWQNNSI